MAVSRKDVLTYLEESNMVEISELISEIEEKFGVSAAAPVAVAVLLQLVLRRVNLRKLNLMLF